MQSKITLEDIKAAQSAVAEMIAKYEASNVVEDMFPINIRFPQLNADEKWLGVVVSANGIKKEHVILLPGEKSDIKWADAMKWAESIGGHLPDRVEQALLFKCMKDEFKEEAYWSGEEYANNTEWAWSQHFDSGCQYNLYKYYKHRARAVRRVEIK